MNKASFEDYTNACKELKSKGVCKLSNNFFDANTLRQLLDDKSCQLHATDTSLMVFIPYHDTYFDCIYLSRNSDTLIKDLNAYVRMCSLDKPIRLSIVGKGKAIEELSSRAEENGFRLQKKLIRIQLEKAPEKVGKAIKILGSEWLPYAGFAQSGDEEEILEILKDNFDLIAENLPELSTIRDNIEKKNVTVLKMDGKIAAVHYFSIVNNISYGYYDVTREEYRHMGGLFFGISLFEQQYFEKINLPIARSFGWRDEKRERLVKSSKKTNGIIDGLAIYNHVWVPQN